MLEKIVNGCASGKPHFAIGILDLVLTCVGHHDYEVSKYVLLKMRVQQ
jgi:transportin-3